MSLRSDLATSVAADLAAIHSQQPIVHNITNYVVMNFNANALLALGALPIMAHAGEELADIVAIAHSLVINIGTLDANWLGSMRLAMHTAREKEIPIIIDPVGAGATSFRTESVWKLISEIKPTVIRGNATEIMALAGETFSRSKGIDSAHQSQQAQEAGKKLAQKYQCIVVISGADDFILNGEQGYLISNGDPMMTKVTGMGCTATAVLGACCAVETDYFLAAVSAMGIMGIAGELAKTIAQGPGTFQSGFLDALYNLHTEEIMARLKIIEVSV